MYIVIDEWLKYQATIMNQPRADVTGMWVDPDFRSRYIHAYQNVAGHSDRMIEFLTKHGIKHHVSNGDFLNFR